MRIRGIVWKKKMRIWGKTKNWILYAIEGSIICLNGKSIKNFLNGKMSQTDILRYLLKAQDALANQRSYENVIAQVLTANGNELFYHTFRNETSRHNYEIDFILARKNKICPIEVKSSGYKTHKSLDMFSEKYSERILKKYIVYTKDYMKDRDVVCLPVYMSPFLWAYLIW